MLRAVTSDRAPFGNSRVVDANGDLVTVFHGSKREFGEFDQAFIGYGNDMWGAGFYFTDREDIARVYAFESKTPQSNVKQFHLNLENPIQMDGTVCTGMGGDFNGVGGYRFGKDTVERILTHHPRYSLRPDQYDEEMIVGVIEERFPFGAEWFEMWGEFGRRHSVTFLKAVRAETGHDGVVVDFGYDSSGAHLGRHYVAWFTEQIRPA